MSLLLDALRKAEAAKQAQRNTTTTAWERPPVAPRVDDLPPLPDLGENVSSITAVATKPHTPAELSPPLPDLPSLLNSTTAPESNHNTIDNTAPLAVTLFDNPTATDLHITASEPAETPVLTTTLAPDTASLNAMAEHTLEFTAVSLPPASPPPSSPTATEFDGALSFTPVEAPATTADNQLTDLLEAPLPATAAPATKQTTPLEPSSPPPFNPTANKSESEKQALAKTLLSAKKITPASPNRENNQKSAPASSIRTHQRRWFLLAGGMSLGVVGWFAWQYYSVLSPATPPGLAQQPQQQTTNTALVANIPTGQLAMSTSLQALPIAQKSGVNTNNNSNTTDTNHATNTSTTTNLPTPTLTEASPSGKPLTPRRTVVRARNDAIQITHTPNAVNENPLLLAAWQHYQQGDFSNAKRLYQQVLQNDRQNTDATLGLAAIAHSQGNNSEAEQQYRRALLLEPRNATAQAGLTALNPGADPALGEAKLKQLLQQQPDAAHLWFALGNYYVGQRQWPDAQQAYFKAVSQEPQHPDYTYNLAVALDHLSQAKAALPYYERAVQLANNGRHAQFNLTQAQRRIQDLRD